ncbi:hypothetical protein ND16A_2658 [Thalassotalea sp. ND16A]|nr:hypothetical protein ND16A_2658 [Thalassotalea sp. ND16A]
MTGISVEEIESSANEIYTLIAYFDKPKEEQTIEEFDRHSLQLELAVEKFKKKNC